MAERLGEERDGTGADTSTTISDNGAGAPVTRVGVSFTGGGVSFADDGSYNGTGVSVTSAGKSCTPIAGCPGSDANNSVTRPGTSVTRISTSVAIAYVSWV